MATSSLDPYCLHQQQACSSKRCLAQCAGVFGADFSINVVHHDRRTPCWQWQISQTSPSVSIVSLEGLYRSERHQMCGPFEGKSWISSMVQMSDGPARHGFHAIVDGQHSRYLALWLKASLILRTELYVDAHNTC